MASADLGVDPANMDLSISPSDDFYHYANGAWLSKNPIPEEYSRWGTFEQLHELSQEHIRAILEHCQTAVDSEKQPDVHEKLVGIMYSSGMDEGTRQNAGLEPMKDVYAVIDAAESPSDVMIATATLRRSGVPSAGFWYVGESTDSKNSSWTVAHVAQSGLGIGDRDFYLSGDEDKKVIREKYVAHLERILAMTGVDDAAGAAKGVMDLETRMAEAHMTKTEKRDPHATYNKFASPAELRKETDSPDVPWEKFFGVYGLEGDDFGGIVVDNTKLATAVSILLGDESILLSTWKNYVRYHATKSMAQYLNNEVVDEAFSFHIKAMTGQPQQKPLWKRVSSEVGKAVEQSLGKLYVARHFAPEAKKACEEMVDAIVEVLAGRFDPETGVTWMGNSTKQRALEKLKAFKSKIGYPDVWDVDHCDELAGDISSDVPYAVNMFAVGKSNIKRMLARINKPRDENRWFMPPFMVNACFIPNRTEILFPAAILQPPFFVAPTPSLPYGDVALNFSAIGSVISHEISHGFDDKGKEYDHLGELSTWWTDEDAAEYDRRTDLLVEQYSKYLVHGQPVNGKLCLGENVADLGGVRLSYDALQVFMKKHGREIVRTVDRFTAEQVFFLGWATIWRNNIRREMSLNRLLTDPHSPGQYRANGPLACLPEFHKSFDVKPGSAMYVEEDKRCEIW